MKNSMFEKVLILQGYSIGEADKEINHIQSLDLPDFQKWQNEKKWDIVNYHYENNNFYKSKITGSLPSKWQKLPIMEKLDYQNEISYLLSTGYDESSVYISNTSGSSGHPFFFAKDKFAHSMSWGLIKSRYREYDIKLNSRQARFFGIPLETSGWLKEKIKDILLNRVRFPIFDMSQHNIQRFIDIFKKDNFLYVYGYVNSLVLFSKELIKMNLRLKDICPTLKYCITTSEMLTDLDRKIINEAFELPIINEYGVSEVGGIVAIENFDGNLRINKETQFIEVVNDNGKNVEAGEEGSILITDLYNKAMPFIRYKVGDIGIIKKNISPDGYQFLEKLSGRTNDNIKLPSGVTSPGLTFYYVSRSILESSGVLKEFIIRQVSIDSFIFDVVSDEEISDEDINDIRKKMDNYLEPGLNLKINRVHSIKRPASGKLKHFYSEIGD